jgi:phosphatidylserine/phosphatidylglycerophosphate/cardiolipin synthase-like enzyme
VEKRRRRLLGGLALGLVLVGGLIALSRCDRGEPSQAAARPALLPQDPDIQIYFNQNPAAGYREVDRLIDRPGDDLEQLFLSAIEGASQGIDLAVYELRLPRIAQALVAKHRAGVPVRVVLDNDNNRSLAELKERLEEDSSGSKSVRKSANQLASQSSDDRPDSTSDQRDKIDYAQRHYAGLVALVDQNQDGQISPDETAQRDAIAILRNAQVPIVDEAEQTSRRRDRRASKGSSLMHHKFLIIDGRQVITGSANLTPSDVHGDSNELDSRGNANHLLAIESQAVANLFGEEFDQLWGDGPKGQKDSHFGQKKTPRSAQVLQVGQSRLTLQFGPRAKGDRARYGHGNQLIADQIKRAKTSIDLALFVFSEPSLTRSLARQNENGVAIRALIDKDFAYRPYSQALPMLGVASSCAPWPHPLNTVGVPIMPPGDRLHHKLALIDDRTLITGSHNWSFAADRRNDETLLVIENPTIAAHVRREFDRLYSKSTLGVPERLQGSKPPVHPPLSCEADR